MSSIRVDEIMTEQIVAISAHERLSTAEDIMRLGGVRHVPVVRSGKLVGVISERDLLRAAPSELDAIDGPRRRAFMEQVEIGDVMSTPAISVASKSSLAEAARLMADRKIGCLPVEDPGGRLLGMVTQTDLLRYLAED